MVESDTMTVTSRRSFHTVERREDNLKEMFNMEHEITDRAKLPIYKDYKNIIRQVENYPGKYAIDIRIVLTLAHFGLAKLHGDPNQNLLFQMAATETKHF